MIMCCLDNSTVINAYCVYSYAASEGGRGGGRFAIVPGRSALVLLPHQVQAAARDRARAAAHQGGPRTWR